MDQPICKDKDCPSSAVRLGLCSSHYQKQRRATAAPCRTSECGKRIHAAGLCRRHYDLTVSAGRSCRIDGCGNVPRALKLCSTHYYRLVAHGDPGEAELRRKPPRDCKVAGCSNPACGRDDLCRTHHDRQRLYGNTVGRLCECGLRTLLGSAYCREHHIIEMKRRIGLGERPRMPGSRRVSTKGHLVAGGYVGFKVADIVILEHRAVMERLIGRDLYPFENVHHKNGRRADNNPSNLELWVKPQPSGQRPEDLVAWVVEFYPDLTEQMLQARKETS